MRLSLIAAVDENGCIGKDGDLAWHYDSDMRWFQRNTIGHPVIMGRKTFESCGNLHRRFNIVLSREGVINDALPVDHGKAFVASYGLFFARSVEEVMDLLEKRDIDAFVIGGRQIYSAFMPYATSIILTLIPVPVQDGDTFFPVWPIPEEWELRDCYTNMDRLGWTVGSAALKFVIYEKVRSDYDKG